MRAMWFGLTLHACGPVRLGEEAADPEPLERDAGLDVRLDASVDASDPPPMRADAALGDAAGARDSAAERPLLSLQNPSFEGTAGFNWGVPEMFDAPPGASAPAEGEPVRSNRSEPSASAASRRAGKAASLARATEGALRPRPRTRLRVAKTSRPSKVAAATDSAQLAESTPTYRSELDEPSKVSEPAELPDAAVAPAPRERARSELELIFEARTVAAREPRAALRLLEEHTARFPDGLLAPEREVLAIEVLRRLRRSQEASARLAAFQQRYPGSVHLRRLESASPWRALAQRVTTG